MDYNRGHEETHKNADEPHSSWPGWSQGPRSDGVMYERVNPFDSMQAHTSPPASTEQHFGLDPYHPTMTWPQQHCELLDPLRLRQADSDLATQQPHVPPSLRLSHEDENDLDFLEHTTSYSTLGSPAFDQTSFLSVSPQMTPGDVPPPHNRSSYFPLGNPGSGSHSPANSEEARTTTSSSARKKERAQHNVVEHRYREKLNSQIAGLRDKVPALREAAHPKKGGKEPAKVGKSSVLVKAGEYIDRLEDENSRLRKRNESLERLVQKLVQGRASGQSGGLDMSEMSHS